MEGWNVIPVSTGDAITFGVGAWAVKPSVACCGAPLCRRSRHLPRRRWLRIPRFRRKAKSSVTAHLLLSPPNPPYRLGFGGDPDGGGLSAPHLFPLKGGMSRSDKGVSFGQKEVNGAFRPKGGNGVHGLFDDAGMSRSDKGVPFGQKEVNGAFRPKGGNGVHGLFDDAGMSRRDRGVLRRSFCPYKLLTAVNCPPAASTPLSAQPTSPLTGETLVGVCRKFPLKGGMSASLTRGFPRGVLTPPYNIPFP